MKQTDSRDILKEKIKIFFENIKPKDIKLIEEEIRHDDRISLGDYYKMLSGRFLIDEASDVELYWILNAISKISSRIGKIEDYFEVAEINNYKYYVNMEDAKNKYKDKIVFKHVQKLAENQYMFPLSVGEIKELKNANKLQIIPELQRNYTKDKYGDLKTKVNRKNAQAIANLIDNGEFFFNGIRFNLMEDEDSESPIYDEGTETLTITKGTIIVPDGNHRSIACELSTKHQDDKFGIFFTYLNAIETRKVLNQEWTTVPIPKQHRESMKLTIPNKIVDAIMRSNEADEMFVKNIVKDGAELRNNHGFISYSEFSNAITKYYNISKLKTKADQDELRDWLILFLNYLTKIMYKDFSNFAKIKKESWSIHYLTIYYYIMISKHLRGNLEWRTYLAKIISETNFKDKNIREYCVTRNKRGLQQFFDRKEEEICTMMS